MLGFFAFAIAVLIKTPSHPISIATHASEASPIPASMINGNFVCSFQVNQINEKIRSRFLNQLLDSHHAVIFLRNEKGADVFTLP